jgi:hypothetical protein
MEVTMPKTLTTGFECNMSTHSGMHVTFANGYTVSVQWSPFNYISDRAGGTHSIDAEVAVMNPDGAFVRGWPHGTDIDDVMGWRSPEQVVEIMAWAAAQPKLYIGV